MTNVSEALTTVRPTVLPYKGVLPRIHASAFLANAIVIGDVEIGEEASLWYNVVVRGDVNQIRIGRRTNIQDGTTVHCTHERFTTVIGDNVTIGHMALLHGCVIEDGAFIGMKACVMDGAVVESGAMVAAGALVTPGKRVKAGELWGGSPARLLRPLTEQDKATLPLTAPHYVRLSRQYLDEIG
ncbi:MULTISPECIES: gamma carbonic anhydrase family protein [Nitrospirillum]|uniref:Carbonic anhydrase/acetyltransferase-like protein (Isoleucine patch superfamily) n=1 Tax=Nitrospirillum amazonense TaxID=28077 RepID=A0A560G4W2_9PROT|nr:gamma carbonic anhydrase family protein [Nitrospirillum amazonense]MEC4591420.1 gamma carbonic anhydrase family protein [Nitrospirillum amazonense]TWB28919.1 carbonic anhydrase/acetyltransferase-like protein (isoleucine patch superfamily) [Nitrospirillum amazonense]